MRRSILILAALCGASVPALQGQTDYYARLGAVGASDLLRDVIVDEITVRQSIAPMLALGASLPVGPGGYRLGLEGMLASGKFHSRESDEDADLGTLRTAGLLLNLEGPLRAGLRWRLGLGGLKYWPSEDEGVFRGGGPIRFLVGAGIDYRRPVLAAWDFMASARYDFHRFTTDELDRRGFSQTQGVSRVSLSVGLARSLR
jgi:hypothetical protein